MASIRESSGTSPADPQISADSQPPIVSPLHQEGNSEIEDVESETEKGAPSSSWEGGKAGSIRFLSMIKQQTFDPYASIERHANEETAYIELERGSSESCSLSSEQDSKTGQTGELKKPEELISQLSDDRVSEVSGPCFACCYAPSIKEPVALDFRNLDEEALSRLSSKQLNKEILSQMSKELSTAESTVLTQNSQLLEEGIISFGTILTSTTLVLPKDSDVPVPMYRFLPPSPFITNNGKLGVDCRAFRLDFTDKANNIVPPFFMQGGADYSEDYKNVLRKSQSYASSILLF